MMDQPKSSIPVSIIKTPWSEYIIVNNQINTKSMPISLSGKNIFKEAKDWMMEYFPQFSLSSPVSNSENTIKEAADKGILSKQAVFDVLDRMILRSTSHQLPFQSGFKPNYSFFNSQGIVLTNANKQDFSQASGVKYELQGEGDVSKQGFFPSQKIYVGQPKHLQARFLTSFEEVFGDKEILKEQNRLYRTREGSLIIQPKNSSYDINTIKEMYSPNKLENTLREGTIVNPHLKEN